MTVCCVRQVKEVKKALSAFVNSKVCSVTAGRIRDMCIRDMHGEAAAGASLLPALAHEMQAQGFYAKVHYAAKDAMVKMTVDSREHLHTFSHTHSNKFFFGTATRCHSFFSRGVHYLHLAEYSSSSGTCNHIK